MQLSPFPLTSTTHRVKPSRVLAPVQAQTCSISVMSIPLLLMVLIGRSAASTMFSSLISKHVSLDFQGWYLQVQATASDTHTGEQEFDNGLINHFKSSSARTRIHLQTHIVFPQHAILPSVLSSAAQTSIRIDSIFEGINIYTSFTCAHF
jgi:hypothetical protein